MFPSYLVYIGTGNGHPTVAPLHWRPLKSTNKSGPKTNKEAFGWQYPGAWLPNKTPPPKKRGKKNKLPCDFEDSGVLNRSSAAELPKAMGVSQWQQPAQRRRRCPRRHAGHGRVAPNNCDMELFTPGKSFFFFKLFACQQEQGVYFKKSLKWILISGSERNLQLIIYSLKMTRGKLCPFLTAHGWKGFFVAFLVTHYFLYPKKITESVSTRSRHIGRQRFFQRQSCPTLPGNPKQLF